MPQIAVAGAPGVVDDPGFRSGGNMQAGPPQAGADVDVFVVEEVAFVESADSLEGLAAKEHEHAGDPVGVDDALPGAKRVAPLLSGH